MIKLTDNHAQRLARMAPARVMPALGEALDRGAQGIVEHARFNLNDGAISGSGHIPGPVGGFPKSDTHELEQSLHKGELTDIGGELRTSAIADAPYAAFVELGTSRAGPRPFMQLTVEELRPAVVEGLGLDYVKQVNE